MTELRSIAQDRALFDYNCGSARYNEPLISSDPLLVTDALVEIIPVLLTKYMVVVLTHAVQPHITRWTIHSRTSTKLRSISRTSTKLRSISGG